LWFLDQLEPPNPLYNIPSAVRLEGRLDVAALQRSLCEVMQRHEVLRTTFPSIHGEPRQVIGSHGLRSLPFVDLSGSDAGPSKVERLATEEAQRPFNLATGPLVRAALLKLSDEKHVLLVTMHHIISDGWSAGVLLRELAVLYEAFSTAQVSPLHE